MRLHYLAPGLFCILKLVLTYPQHGAQHDLVDTRVSVDNLYTTHSNHTLVTRGQLCKAKLVVKPPVKLKNLIATPNKKGSGKSTSAKQTTTSPKAQPKKGKRYKSLATRALESIPPSGNFGYTYMMRRLAESGAIDLIPSIYMPTAVIRRFEDGSFAIGTTTSETIRGCTLLFVIAQTQVWSAHIWESDLEDTKQSSFNTHVTKFIDNGMPPYPGLKSDAHDFSGAELYVVTPQDAEFDHGLDYIHRQIFDITCGEIDGYRYPHATDGTGYNILLEYDRPSRQLRLIFGGNILKTWTR